MRRAHFAHRRQQNLWGLSDRHALAGQPITFHALGPLQSKHGDAQRLQHRYRSWRFRRGFRSSESPERRPHLQPTESRIRIDGDADRRPDLLRRLQRGEPCADGHRARLRQSRSALRTAQCLRKRSGFAASGRSNRGGGRTRQSPGSTADVERGCVPHGQQQ